jgi:hypothetical protein
MSETQHLKCPCQHCEGPIEFPAHGLGLAIDCPHCGEKTTLFAPPAGEVPPAASLDAGRKTLDGEPAPSKSRMVWWSLLVLFAVVVGSALFIYRDHWARSKSPKPTGTDTTRISDAAPESNAPAVRPAAPAATNAPKSLADFKVGPITLEKTKGSSLVHAVGVLRNESDHQRFGVTIELSLNDARGAPAGTARDYRAVLEPRQSWRFRALVLDGKAVSAAVAAIREQE